MIEVKVNDLGGYVGSRFSYDGVIFGIAVHCEGEITDVRPIDDLFGLGDTVVEYVDNDEVYDFFINSNENIMVEA